MTKIKVDPDIRLAEQKEIIGHNRWHPDIPPIATLKPGDEIYVEALDFLDCQIANNDDVSDIINIDLTRAHPLSGPFRIEGAEPGDLLVVDLLDIGPITDFGFTGIFAKENGGGFLTDYFPNADKAIWDFHGIYTTSRHVPGVRFAGLQHPGQIGTAPSMDLLHTWNKREAPLAAKGRATLPFADTAFLGSLKGAEFDRVAKEACRTVPPRENGGNTDIKNITRGSRIYFPVYVDGANFSGGDLHFSQGDGEIAFCGAIEMKGFMKLGFDIIKGGVAKYKITNPIFVPGPMDVRFEKWLMFEGICVEDGIQYDMDATVAYRRACMNCIDYLTTQGFTGEQAYMLLTACPMEGRIGGIVDIPNCACTVALPLDIFDRDILPKK